MLVGAGLAFGRVPRDGPAFGRRPDFAPAPKVLIRLVVRLPCVCEHGALPDKSNRELRLLFHKQRE